MDTFQLLSKGGARFDKRRFRSDVRLFNPRKGEEEDIQMTDLHARALPPELDFFKYATGAAAAERAATGMNRTLGFERDHDSSDSNESTTRQEKRGEKRKRYDEAGEVGRTLLTPHRIKTTGESVPVAFTAFEELEERYNVAPELLRNIEKTGYKAPTGVQSQGIPILLEKRDLAAIAPTGSGKTLAYLLPLFCLLRSPARSLPAAVQGGTRTLILSPTRELAQQIHNEALKLTQGRKWKVVVLSKATGNAMRDKDAKRKVDVLISTPLGLVTALQDAIVELDNVRHVILDEADRLLEEGFLQQIEQILGACTHPEVQKAVFSATLPAAVEAIANTFLTRPIRVIVGLKDSATDTIAQTLTFCGSELGKLHALRNLIAEGIRPPVLIFVQSIERATELFHELLYDGINVDVMHSDRTKAQREDTVRRFRQGEVWVLVATELMARGMDFRGVNLVVNYDFPQSVQSYIHRIGRTGRAGRSGQAITYFTKEDAPYLKSVANVLKASGQEVPEYMLDLPKPSKMKKRELKRKPIERKDISRAAGAGVGRNLAIKRRDMIQASKRRKATEQPDRSPTKSQSEP